MSNESMNPKEWEALKAVAMYAVMRECGNDLPEKDPELTALFMRLYLLGFKAGSPAELFDNIDFD